MDALDWSRPVLAVLPGIGLTAGVVTGIAGMGGGIVATSLWQLTWALFHVPEMDSLDLLVMVVTLQQFNTVISFACSEWRVWRRHALLGASYAVAVMLFSPLGVLCRERLEPELIRLALAWVLLVFVGWKLPLPRRTEAAGLGKPGDAASAVSPQICGKNAEGAGPGLVEPPGLDEARGLKEAGAAAASAAAAAAAAAANLGGVGGGPASPQRKRPARRAERGAGSAAAEEAHEEGRALNAAVAGAEEPHEEQLEASLGAACGEGGLRGGGAAGGGAAPSGRAPSGFDERGLRWHLPLSGAFSGLLNGVCGLGGPPYVILVTLCSVPKELARPMFPLGMVLELPLRLALTIRGRGLLELAADAHVIVLTLVLNSLGLWVGCRASALISQRAFEAALFFILALSSLVVLGLLEASFLSLEALLLVGAMVALRSACGL